jgi:hypothetical protein
MNALHSMIHNPANDRPDGVSVRAAAIERSNTEALPYLETAVPIGLTGAAAVAVFVFLIDLAAGQPLATPNALGAAIFRGIAFDLATPIEAIHVLSYTLLHSALFVIAATAAIVSEFSFSEKGISLGKQFLPGTAALFVALQASILTLVALLDLPVSNRFEFGRLLAINGVAAFAMSTTTYYWARARLSMDDDSA